ncbi:MAG: hypothetical protein WDN45_09545 [Caulobacteraceae bacterium]
MIARKTVLRRASALAAVLAALSALPAHAEGDLRGFWRPDHYQAALKTIEGKTPAYVPPPAPSTNSGSPTARRGALMTPLAACLPAGTPRIMFQPRPFMVVQTPLKVTFVHEYEHILRHVYLNEALNLPARIRPGRAIRWGGGRARPWWSPRRATTAALGWTKRACRNRRI